MRCTMRLSGLHGVSALFAEIVDFCDPGEDVDEVPVWSLSATISMPPIASFKECWPRSMILYRSERSAQL
jgi:hypothetical protein